VKNEWITCPHCGRSIKLIVDDACPKDGIKVEQQTRTGRWSSRGVEQVQETRIDY
jgi:hypothetical protein